MENSENKKISSFTDLRAWKEGHKLVLSVYKIVKIFPREELFSLSTQMKRSAVSVTSNIAEGFGRWSWKEKKQFYYIAKGSITELQNQLFVARDTGLITKEQFQTVIDQTVNTEKIIFGLIKGLH